MNRRQFLGLAGAGAAAMVAGAGWATLVEPNWPVTERREVRLARLPARLDGLRIAQLSDIHLSRLVTPGDLQRAVHLVNRQTPDLVVLTGDFIWRDPDMAAGLVEPLQQLAAPLGVFAIFGTHDHWAGPEQVAAALAAAGVTLLVNQSMQLATDAPLWLAGLDDVWERRQDIRAALRDVPPDECTVLLCHEPDYGDEAAAYPVDLQLSGHSHGGQINLPLVGPPVLPWLGRKYPAGLYRIADLQIYTNRGIGLIAPAVRFNCPPEVTVLTLRGGAVRPSTNLRHEYTNWEA